MDGWISEGSSYMSYMMIINWKLHWRKLLQSHQCAFISGPERTFQKNSDDIPRNIDKSIKEAQERKSNKKSESATKFSYLKMFHKFQSKSHFLPSDQRCSSCREQGCIPNVNDTFRSKLSQNLSNLGASPPAKRYRVSQYDKNLVFSNKELLNINKRGKPK